MNGNQTTSSASKIIHMNEKKCSKCLEIKSLNEFYISTYVRSECKLCTRAHVKATQKTYKEKYPTPESREGFKSYYRDYYSQNKEKMKQYRDEFKRKHPGYQQQYRRAKVNQDTIPESRLKEMA